MRGLVLFQLEQLLLQIVDLDYNVFKCSSIDFLGCIFILVSVLELLEFLLQVCQLLSDLTVSVLTDVNSSLQLDHLSLSWAPGQRRDLSLQRVELAHLVFDQLNLSQGHLQLIAHRLLCILNLGDVFLVYDVFGLLLQFL